MPTVTGTANHWCWCHDNRRDHTRRYDNCWTRCNYDWPIRPTSAIGSAVKADTTSARSIGAVD